MEPYDPFEFLKDQPIAHKHDVDAAQTDTIEAATINEGALLQLEQTITLEGIDKDVRWPFRPDIIFAQCFNRGQSTKMLPR